MTKRLVWMLGLGVSVLCGCVGSSPVPEENNTVPASRTGLVSADKNDYPVFPNSDEGADPQVSAEDGGSGFAGEAWETNLDFDLMGDPSAVRGGVIRSHQLDFPTTFRSRGPNTTEFDLMLDGLVYEGLLTLHPTTTEWMPALATHWQISPDRLTYRYRINPNARFSDGEPVTADDVVATWELMMDPGLQDPAARLVYGKYNRPVAETPYIVSVTSTQLNWRNFLYFSSMPIYPAHVLNTIDGETYLRDYNYKMLPGTGPYIVNEADVDRGNRVVIRRRSDYWAESSRRNVGLHNFDEIHQIVVRDDNLAFEMFKRGDLDYYHVNVSREWVEELDTEPVQRGLLQKRKVFNEYPLGMSGIAFNARREPWQDVRVRRALAHLYNRQLMIEKLFFGEYFRKTSYFSGPYRNPGNPDIRYDPELAVSLLAEAGWTERNSQGRLVKDGQSLTAELLYGQQGLEPSFTMFQEDLRRVGITLNLRLVTFETMIQLIDERRFDLVSVAYTGLLFPNPETTFHSSLADVDNTNNITAVKSPRIDELLIRYDTEFGQQAREEIIREVDGILGDLHNYILGWEAPFFRIAFWNKFGSPEGYLSRFGYYRDPLSLWWFHPQKEARWRQAMANTSETLEVGETDVHYWEQYVQDSGQSRAMPDGH